MEGRLWLILVMWPSANLISLACSGQHAQLDGMCVCVRDCVFVCLCLGPSGPVDATTLADGSNNGIGERERGRGGEKCVRLKELVNLALFTQEISLRTTSVLQERPENKLHLSKITTGKLINSKQPSHTHGQTN